MADEKHCPTCICGMRAPVQAETTTAQRIAHITGKPAGSVTWQEHLQAWSEYAARYPGQSAEVIAGRGGFGYYEMTEYLGHEPTTWEPR